MFRIRLIQGDAFVLSTDRLEQVKSIFRESFPFYADYAEKLPELLDSPVGQGYRAALLTAEGAMGRVDAFALVLYFEETQSAFLDFVGTRPEVRGRGIGGALYEAVREYCQRLGARGLYFDVQPDDPELTPDPDEFEESKRRIAFYERYGVRAIEGTAYHTPFGDPPETGLLMFDGLGREEPLSRDEARRTVELLLRRRFGHGPNADYLRLVVDSFTDDPVRFRPFLYRKESRVQRAVKPHRLPSPYGLVLCPKHAIHHVRERGYIERPVRANVIRESLMSLGLFREIRLRHFGQGTLKAIHDADFRQFLRNVCGKLKAGRPVYPEAFPIRRPEHRPKHLPEQAGYYCLDADTPLYRNAYVAALDAVDAALTGAEEVLAGSRLAYAVCRPPGHHAGRRFYGGFCYFNNAAAAAHYLSRQVRVAVLDIDFHHGNGTQDIFYERDDVITASIHGHPDHAYPHFSGFPSETGAGFGLGCNRNLPLPPDTGEARYMEALDKALAFIRKGRPGALVLSLGFDTMRGDPTGTFLLGARGLRSIARRLAQTGLPLLVVQEGGYSIRNIRRGSAAFFDAFAEADTPLSKMPSAK